MDEVLGKLKDQAISRSFTCEANARGSTELDAFKDVSRLLRFAHASAVAALGLEMSEMT